MKIDSSREIMHFTGTRTRHEPDTPGALRKLNSTLQKQTVNLPQHWVSFGAGLPAN